jgi:phosphotriesterase-related protein
MGTPDLVGKAQTVLGTIEAEDLNIVLPHEHCLIDMSVWFQEPTTASEKLIAHQPLAPENLWYVRYHPFSCMDNIQLLDEQLAIEELKHFKLRGGSTVVDVTNIGIGRNPLALTRISKAASLNIIMGSGYYVEKAQPAGISMSMEMIAEDIVRDITVGVGNTGVRAGLIGEIGIMGWPMLESERKSLHAAAIAQKQTGAPISIHPGNSPNSPLEIIEVLDKAGADISRVIMSHIERTIPLRKDHIELAKTGCYLAWDMFSLEGWYSRRIVTSEDTLRKADLPNDAQRVDDIMAIIDEGFLKQVLISHDVCLKQKLCLYGGPGYAHILQNVVPLLMRKKGMAEEHINTLLIENPKRIMCFV